MKKMYFVIVGLLIFYSPCLFAQYHVKPNVEVFISYDENFSRNIYITWIHIVGGSEYDETISRIQNVSKSKSDYVFMDMDPGSYLIGAEYSDGSNAGEQIILEVVLEDFIEDNTLRPSADFKIMNEFSITKGRNYKIELALISDNLHNTFTDKSVIHYQDYDYMKLTYNIGSIAEDLDEDQLPEMGGSKASSRDRSNQSFPSACLVALGGTDKKTLYSKNGPCPGEECKEKLFDFKSAKVKLITSNEEKSKGYERLGEEFLDEYSKKKKIRYGAFRFSYRASSNATDGYCCPKNCCFRNIGNITFKIYAKIFLWKKTELCAKFPKMHCDCLFQKALFHERFHCNTFYTSLTAKLNTFNLCTTNAVSVCETFVECSDKLAMQEAFDKAIKPLWDFFKAIKINLSKNDHTKLYGNPNDPHDGLNEKIYDQCVKNSQTKSSQR